MSKELEGGDEDTIPFEPNFGRNVVHGNVQLSQEAMHALFLNAAGDTEDGNPDV